MFAWIELQKEPIPIVLGLISIVAVFNILTILLITVVEKTHSIGILRALGLTNREIISIFIYQGTSIGFFGTLLGCGLALAFSIVQQQYGLIHLPGEIYFMDKLPVAINPIHYVIVIGISVVLSLAATLIPSFIAVKINTIKALRFK
jgi:lipoprotein-releasing system permease protein